MPQRKPAKNEPNAGRHIQGFDPVLASQSVSSQSSKSVPHDPPASHETSAAESTQSNALSPSQTMKNSPPPTQTPGQDFGHMGRPHGSCTASISLHPASKLNLVVPDVEENPETSSAMTVAETCLRPGYRSVGKPVQVLTNHFQVILSANLVLHRYSVTVEPELNGKKRKQLLKVVLESILELASVRKNLVTDFQHLIISCSELPFIPDAVVKYRTESQLIPGTRAQEYIIRIRRVYTQQRLDVSELLQRSHPLQENDSFSSKTHLFVEALNILLGHHARASSSIATIGAKRVFDVSSGAPKYDLGAALVALRGFFSSAKITDGRVLSNVNVSYGAFYDPIRLDMLMNEYCTACGLGWDPESLKKLEKFVKGLRIEVPHLEKTDDKGNAVKKFKTVFGLANESIDGKKPWNLKEGKDTRKQGPSPRFRTSLRWWTATSGPVGAGPKDVEFFLETKSEEAVADVGPNTRAAGRYISVWKYFQEKGKSIKEDTCLVNVGNARFPVYLPPDLCRVAPGQPFKSKLSPRQTEQMISHAVRAPKDTENFICNDGLRVMGFSQPQKMPYTTRVLPHMITVESHVLEPPKIQYKDDTTAQPRTGAWHMGPAPQPDRSTRTPKFYATKSLRPWICLAITNSGDIGDIHKRRLASFIQAMNNAGVATHNPEKQMVIRESNSATELPATFSKWSDKLNSERGHLFVLVMLPCKSTVLYNRIKQLGDKKYGIQTLCIGGSEKFYNQGLNRQGRPVFDGVSYFANVALKVNLKLKGINHVLGNSRTTIQNPNFLSKNGALGIISEGKTMVLGIDVTHPSPGSAENAPSVAAMVVSTDNVLAQWPASLRIQKTDTKKLSETDGKVKGARQEMVSDIKSMFLELLKMWKRRNHEAFPENILIYRDGVSESQYAEVLRNELQPLRDACKDIYPPQMKDQQLPRFTLIIVGKRHHTRFFPKPGANTTSDLKGNPEPGLIVDRDITSSREFDFFLQSHAAIQGTARPAHYVVLVDEIFTNIYAPKGKKPFPGQCKNVADVIQTLTHNMCYLYGRATRAVSYCPAAFYADRACERARRYLGDKFDAPEGSVTSGRTTDGPDAVDEDVTIHPRLADTMFYI